MHLFCEYVGLVKKCCNATTVYKPTINNTSYVIILGRPATKSALGSPVNLMAKQDLKDSEKHEGVPVL